MYGFMSVCCCISANCKSQSSCTTCMGIITWADKKDVQKNKFELQVMKNGMPKSHLPQSHVEYCEGASFHPQ
jgi:hypothetical protein